MTVPQNQEELAAWGKALHSEIGAKAEKSTVEAAFADFNAKFAAMEQRRLLDVGREARPEGGNRLLCERSMDKDGLRLVAAEKSAEFAGMQVKFEHEGLFSMAPTSEWHADLLRCATAKTLLKQAGKEYGKVTQRALVLAAQAPTEGGIRAGLEASVRKAMSDTSGSGGEWVPDVFSGRLYEDFYLDSGLSGAFDSEEVSGGSTLFPTITDTGTPYIRGKASTNNPTQYTASNVTSGQETVTPVDFAVRFVVDESLSEDSIFGVVPELMRRAARALNDGYTDSMVNGDTAATHQDAIASWNPRTRWMSASLGASNDHRRSQLGLRALAFDRAANYALTTQTPEGILELLVGPMGEQGAGEHIVVVSPEFMFKKLLLSSSVVTVDKMGPKATILSGQLAAIFGMPVLMERFVTSDVNASGLFDNVTTTKSSVLVVNRMAFKHYNRRGSRIETEKDITTGAFQIVATMRRTFKTLSASAQKVVTVGYNAL